VHAVTVDSSTVKIVKDASNSKDGHAKVEGIPPKTTIYDGSHEGQQQRSKT